MLFSNAGYLNPHRVKKVYPSLTFYQTKPECFHYFKLLNQGHWKYFSSLQCLFYCEFFTQVLDLFVVIFIFIFIYLLCLLCTRTFVGSWSWSGSRCPLPPERMLSEERLKQLLKEVTRLEIWCHLFPQKRCYAAARRNEALTEPLGGRPRDAAAAAAPLPPQNVEVRRFSHPHAISLTDKHASVSFHVVIVLCCFRCPSFQTVW